MKTLPPVAIHNKYDLMHRNTPTYASTVITWDTGKMGAITKKRVIEWLKTSTPKYQRGEAAGMYRQLRKRFGLPEFRVDEYKPPSGGRKWGNSGVIKWENPSEGLMHALNQVYQAERVIQRIQQPTHSPWYLQDDTLNPSDGYFYIDNEHDLTEINAEIAKVLASPENAVKTQEAIRFVEEGGTFTFTYGV